MAAKKKSSAAAASATPASDPLMNLAWFGAVAYALLLFLINAYVIRMQAIDEYGPVIHEFDPYFNWRATQVSTCDVGNTWPCFCYLLLRTLTSYCTSN